MMQTAAIRPETKEIIKEFLGLTLENDVIIASRADERRVMIPAKNENGEMFSFEAKYELYPFSEEYQPSPGWIDIVKYNLETQKFSEDEELTEKWEDFERKANRKGNEHYFNAKVDIQDAMDIGIFPAYMIDESVQILPYEEVKEKFAALTSSALQINVDITLENTAFLVNLETEKSLSAYVERKMNLNGIPVSIECTTQYPYERDFPDGDEVQKERFKLDDDTIGDSQRKELESLIEDVFLYNDKNAEVFHEIIKDSYDGLRGIMWTADCGDRKVCDKSNTRASLYFAEMNFSLDTSPFFKRLQKRYNEIKNKKWENTANLAPDEKDKNNTNELKY